MNSTKEVIYFYLAVGHSIISFIFLGEKMKNLDLELKEIQLQNEKLLRELAEVHELLTSVQPQKENKKEFYTIEQCVSLKGGAALNTYKANRLLLPGAGNPQYASYIGGRLCFAHDVVMKWLRVTDADYPEYARSCGVSILPEKFAILAKKAKEKVGEL